MFALVKLYLYCIFNIILNDPHLLNIFPDRPITALRANKNIAEYLVRADLKTPPQNNLDRPHLYLPSYNFTDYCDTTVTPAHIHNALSVPS